LFVLQLASDFKHVSHQSLLVIFRRPAGPDCRPTREISRAEHHNDLAKQLWAVTAQELRRVQQHSLVLIMSAEERVVGFLFEMASRSSGGMAIELPMSRQDIADYLGLTIETVSRTFTQLVQSGVIALETSRRVHFRNRAALNRLNA